MPINNDDFFNLDFPQPEEQTNYKVDVKDLYEVLLSAGFKFSDIPDGVGSAYIMRDGKFLFLEQNKDILEASTVTHGTLDLWLQENGYIGEYTMASRLLCQTDGAIRINDGTNFSLETIIGLPEKQISFEQSKSLDAWMWSMIRRNKFSITVGNELVSEAFRTYDLREVDPKYVTRRIDAYYRNGILREAKDIKQDKEEL